MKILSVHKYYADRDGASHYQLEVNRLLEARGHEVIPFGMKTEETLPSPWSEFFLSPVETRHPSWSLRAFKTVGRMLYSREARRQLHTLVHVAAPDVAHLHNIYTQISPSIFPVLRRHEIPTVMTVHDYHLVAPNYMLWSHGRVEDLSRSGIARATLSRFHKGSFAASFLQAFVFKLHKRLRLYERGVDRFICPSTFVKDVMQRAGYAGDVLVVVPHFVETKDKRPVYDGDGSVLFVGRFTEEKGVLFVLELARALPDVRFVLAGDGPLWNEVERQSFHLENVRLTGWADRSKLRELYQAASLVLVPSLWPEVFGLVALEGMAYGKPVLASRMGGLPEVVLDQKTGRVLPAGSVSVWKRAIRELLADESRRMLYAKNARQDAEVRFSPTRHIADLLEVFASVL